MRLRNFTAPTMSDAMAQVRAEMGDDAIIAARILFGLAFASAALVLYAGVDLLSSAPQ